MTELQQLKIKIQKANPDSYSKPEVYNRCMRCGFQFGYCQCGDERIYQDPNHTVRPIRLADVLLAMRKNNRGQFYLRDDGTLFEWDGFHKKENHTVKPTWIEWNLANDSLDAQSPELHQFLIKLLK